MTHQLPSKPLSGQTFIEYAMMGVIGLAILTGLAGLLPQLAAILALIPTGFMIFMAKKDSVSSNGTSFLVASAFTLAEIFNIWFAFDGTIQGPSVSAWLSGIISSVGLMLLYMRRAEMHRKSNGVQG
jgi:hypothetical protein